MEYIQHVLAVGLLYVVIIRSLDLLVGHTGLVSVGHASFVAVGAYTAAIGSTKFALPPVATLLIAALFAAVASLAISLPALRLSDDFFVLATFAFQVVVNSIAINWTSLTRGPAGIANVPELALGPVTLRTKAAYLGVVAAMVLIVDVASRRVVGRGFGLVLHGLKEDEVLVRSCGFSAVRYKTQVSAVAAITAAIAGAVWAFYFTYVDPSTFALDESITLLAAVVAGGAGTRRNAYIGAAVMIGLPEAMRFLGFPAPFAGLLRQCAFGVLLIVVARVRLVSGGRSE